MPRKPIWPPPVHVRRGRAFMRVRVGPGEYRDITLGEAGSAEARQEYARLLAELEAHGGAAAVDKKDLTVLELSVAYLRKLKADGEDVRTYHRALRALQPVQQLYGHTAAAEFGPRALRTVRQWYVDQRFGRRYVNHLLGKVRHLFRWAVAEQLVPVAVADALDALPGLRKRGRKRREDLAGPPEPERVRPADPAAFEATLPWLPRQVADLCRVLRYTGMRPGEGCRLHAADIRFDWLEVGGVRVWLYEVDGHKTEWRGEERWLPIGPRAQAVLAPWLADRPPDAYCFSPYEVRAEWCLARGRRAEFGEGRRPGDCYTTQSLDRCVRRAVRRAGVARWTPNMLRHLVATVVEVERGREDARVVMGHATPTTTSIYAEQVERAARVMAEMG